MEPAWLRIARGELGTKEVQGDKDNPRIIEYHSTTTLKATDDITPWCSAFTNWCFYKAGIKGTRSAAAKSWLHWGKDLKTPQVGCVVVLWRKNPTSPSGHVGFWLAEDASTVTILGGNQNDSVCIAKYDKTRILAYRWPE